MNNIICYHAKDEFLKNLKEFDVCGNPFESYAFFSVYLKYYPNGNFYFFDVYEDDKKIGIIPMECTCDSKLFNTKYFRFVGYRQFNYEQYICRDEDVEKVHRLFISYLAEQKYRSLVNFYDINDSTQFYQLLNESELKKKSLKLYLCPCLHFTDSFDEFFKTVYSSAKKRTELKKFQKKLNEIGDFKIINIENKESHDTYKKYLDQIYRVHAERFTDVYATSFFGAPKMRPYYSELIESLIRDGKGHISLLLMGEVVIAFIFCLTNGETLIDWIPAFDPAYSKYSLGIVQYKMLFEKMCTAESPYKTFDYSKGSSVYKRKWAKEETANYQFVVQTSRQNIFSWLLYQIESNKFTFKCYLREKGVLGKIKRFLGGLLAKKEGKKAEPVRIVYVEEEMNPKLFDYASIRGYPIGVRKAVLDALYQGDQFVSIEKLDAKYVVKLQKTKE